tara:strand:- start:674 stop:1000 length:327 start_codon:yes stop_codon:yes gene_type:complete
MNSGNKQLLKEALEAHNIFLTERIKSDTLNMAALKDKLSLKFPILAENSSIMAMTLSDKYDHNILTYMLNMKEKMDNGSLSEREASINVGQILVDKVVKPSIEKNKNK